MNTPIIIAGPTGSGKTEIAVELAKLTNGEIISADSRQVYRYLDIGTNKAGTWDNKLRLRTYKSVPQHLTDIIDPIDPAETFNAGEFAKAAELIIEKLSKTGKTPIITGGTGLYIKAMVDGLSPMPGADQAVRERLKKEFLESGEAFLLDKLMKVDPVSAEKNRHNPQRIIRALEVFEITKTPISELQKIKSVKKYGFLQIGLLWDRDELNKNLDKRSDTMLESGMINETKEIVKNYGDTCPGLSGIGYNHIIKYIKGRITYDEMRELFKRDIRRYAKRQITWFKKDTRISWIYLTNSTFDTHAIAVNILKSLPK
ncbi:MAG: tRNA (adenosine(37)-N6)-dimethylallyltransferase MiaA [Elusimicrobia bacterium]|nr:tRNA (adenosine(37)-N6)-dimethylallyltransferase MiaA [Candidatus Liberimonas magnetica]